MRDRYIVFSDGRRTFVRDLSDAEIADSLQMIDQLEPMDGTDASHKDMRHRLILEQQMRAMGAR